MQSMTKVENAVAQAKQSSSLCDFRCSTCDRRLAVITRDTPAKHMLEATLMNLDPEDFCRWCARPITERAQREAPVSGYSNLARAIFQLDRTWGRRDPIRAEGEG